MSTAAHLAELERRHRALEAEIVEARAHPSIDHLQIVELKRRKLLVKDEIASLQNLITRWRRSRKSWRLTAPMLSQCINHAKARIATSSGGRSTIETIHEIRLK